MITIQKETAPSTAIDFSAFSAAPPYLFFDIETTGLSRDKNQIYLIGALLFTPDSAQAKFRQWLAGSEAEETPVLAAFLDFIRQLPAPPTLVHFNGARFDIPFFLTRCARNKLDCQCFSQLPDTDLYQQIKPYKNLLGLPNCRQKTIEDFLRIRREDQCNGGELIPVFHKYCKGHGQQEEALLLLHNQEDVENMPRLTGIFSYVSFFRGAFRWDHCEEARYTDWEGREKKELFVVYQTDDGRKIPSALTLHRDFSSLQKQKSTSLAGQFWMACKETELTLRIPLMEGKLKYFFEDYKNYYYLPMEDQAVHKSVAQYMDPEYRKKATAKTCYNRIQGTFLPAVSASSLKPCFYAEYGSRQPWLRWEHKETLCGMPAADFFAEYLRALLEGC